MLRWYPDPLLRWVLELTFVPVIFLAVLCLRCACDAGTPWAVGTLRGPGMSADFWVLVLFLVLGVSTIALGWRGARRLFRVQLLIWHLTLTAITLWALQERDPLVVSA